MFQRLAMSAVLPALLAATGSAAPLPRGMPNGQTPTLLIQTSSIQELETKVRRAFQNFFTFGPAPVNFGLAQLVGEENLRGVDPTRRAALYAVINDNIVTSQVVALVPVTGEDEFVRCVRGAGVTVTAGVAGYTLDIPDLTLPVYMAFADDYAYLSLGSPMPIAGKQRVAPEAVISAEETSLARAQLRIDRLPEPLKELAIEQLKELPSLMPNGLFIDDRLGEASRLGVTVGGRWAEPLLHDATDLSLRFDLDDKTGSLVGEAKLATKPGSELANTFARPAPTNRFASLAGDSPVARYQFKLPLLEEEHREMFVLFADLASDQIKQQADGLFAELYGPLHEGLKRTIRAGEFDLTAALIRPGETYAAVGAFTFRDTGRLSDALKAALANPPKGLEGVFAFDVDTVDGVPVHEAKLGKAEISLAARLGIAKVFGSTSVHFAFGKDRVVAVLGAEWKEQIGKALAAEPTAAPVLLFDQDMNQAIDLVAGLGVPLDEEIRDAFKKMGRVVQIGLDLRFAEGTMNARLEVGTFGLMMFGVAARSAEAVPAAPAPVPAAPVPALGGNLGIPAE